MSVCQYPGEDLIREYHTVDLPQNRAPAALAEHIVVLQHQRAGEVIERVVLGMRLERTLVWVGSTDDSVPTVHACKCLRVAIVSGPSSLAIHYGDLMVHV